MDGDERYNNVKISDYILPAPSTSDHSIHTQIPNTTTEEVLEKDKTERWWQLNYVHHPQYASLRKTINKPENKKRDYTRSHKVNIDKKSIILAHPLQDRKYAQTFWLPDQNKRYHHPHKKKTRWEKDEPTQRSPAQD